MSALPVEQLLDVDEVAVLEARKAIATARSYGPLRAVTPEQAPVIRRATDYDPSLRPRWQRGGEGIHVTLPPTAYAEGRRYVRTGAPVRDEDGRLSYRRRADTGAPLVQWSSREHWLRVVVPAAIEAAPDHAKTATGAIKVSNGSVAAATLLIYAEQLSKFADERTGRRCIVRVDKLAELLEFHKRTVQRCQEALERLGVYVVMLPGRMLDEDETYRARRGGSRQRGLANDAALVVPHWLPRDAVRKPAPPSSRPSLRLILGGRLGDHVTSTSGNYRNSSNYLSVVPSASTQSTSGRRKEPTPSAPRRRKSAASRRRKAPQEPQNGAVSASRRVYDPSALHVAFDLTERLSWLRDVPPGRIEPMLRRFTGARLAWTAADVVAALDFANRRLGRASMTHTLVRNPVALLAKNLRDLDVDADHPRLDDEPNVVRRPAASPRQVENQRLLAARRAGVPGHRLAPASPAAAAGWLRQIRADLAEQRTQAETDERG